MRVGILGGGQLAQMLVLAGVPLGIDFLCLDPEASCPASKVAKIIQADYSDLEAVKKLASSVDVLTFESENIPTDFLKALKTPLFPTCEALEVAQDRLTEKQFFTELKVPVTAFRAVDEKEDLHRAIEALGLPVLLKTRRHGYDGKGQRVIRKVEEAELAFEALAPNALIVEKWFSFDTEVSLIAVRSQRGEIHFYPLTENVHREGILRLSKAPFLNESLVKKAQSHLQAILEKLNYVGVLAVEFFVKGDGLVANEMAPRVHNSGHWTIEGAVTSQFENHLRAILGLPLGKTDPVGYSAMVNFIGEIPPIETLLQIPALHVHLYGKAPRPLRKLGHGTLCLAREESAKIKQVVELLLG